MMNEAMDIRRAGPNDVAGCAAVANDWIDRTEWLPRVHSHKMVEGFVRDGLRKREIWVVCDPIEGYLSFNPEEQQIGALFCRRTGEGLGKALMDRVKEGRRYLQLWTHVPNTSAQRFYVREGFVPCEEADAEPPETVRELRMEWRA